MAGYESAEESVNELERTEEFDGYRLSWNRFPKTRIGATKLKVPVGALYTPLQNQAGTIREVYQPHKCSKCGGILNCFAMPNSQTNSWTCNFCGTHNSFPHNFRYDRNHQPLELEPQNTTIEYCDDQQQPQFPPALLFVIDTCLDGDELEGLCTTIKSIFSILPEDKCNDMYIGVITFGKHVQLHEIGFEGVKKIHSFRGDSEEGKHLTVQQIKDQLKLTSDDIMRFLQPIAQCEDAMTDILGNLKLDVWPAKARQRMHRCTGAAIQVAVALMESLCPAESARIMVFSGGAPTCGPGQVVDISMEHHLRSHREIKDGKAVYYEKAVEFYKGLAKVAAGNSHVIDMFACALDQTGVEEQKYLVSNTGGTLILSDTFSTGSNAFAESFQNLFEMVNYDDYEDLQMCFNAEITVVTSPEVNIAGCIGPVVAMDTDKVNNVAAKAIGVGGTSKWSIGGLDPAKTLAFYFEIANNKEKAVTQDQYCHIQFITTYRDAAGYNVTRTTSLAVALENAESPQGLSLLKQGFDEEAAAVLLARHGAWKAENEYDPTVINWLDRILIGSMAKVATYKADDPSTFKLPPEFTYFPSFLYYLRRSQFVRVFGYSPDESAYFRHWLCRSCVVDSMTMIQPTLTEYDADGGKKLVLLDSSSLKPDVILILDTFFHVVKWEGEDVVHWRANNFREDPEYEYLGEFMDASEEDMIELCRLRFPYPTEVRTHHMHSQERFLKARVNPATRGQGGPGGTGGVWTDDVNLQTFLNHLRRLATQYYST